MEGGSLTVEQLGPPLPAETTTKIPAAWVLLTMVSSSMRVVQPSLEGQPQELLSTCGRKVGFALFPLKSVGAIMNWKHSV
jgi:hypothetical protein